MGWCVVIDPSTHPRLDRRDHIHDVDALVEHVVHRALSGDPLAEDEPPGTERAAQIGQICASK
jgi:hypothetical protein